MQISSGHIPPFGLQRSEHNDTILGFSIYVPLGSHNFPTGGIVLSVSVTGFGLSEVDVLEFPIREVDNMAKNLVAKVELSGSREGVTSFLDDLTSGSVATVESIDEVTGFLDGSASGSETKEVK